VGAAFSQGELPVALPGMMRRPDGSTTTLVILVVGVVCVVGDEDGPCALDAWLDALQAENVTTAAVPTTTFRSVSFARIKTSGRRLWLAR
jgi:hypothetical protein